MSVCTLYVCMYVSFSFFAIYSFTQKIFKQPIPQNLRSYAIFFCGCPYEKRNFKNLVYEGVQHFLSTKYKIISCFNQKNLFTTLVEIIFIYHKIFLRVLGPPTNKMKYLNVRSWVSK